MGATNFKEEGQKVVFKKISNFFRHQTACLFQNEKNIIHKKAGIFS